MPVHQKSRDDEDRLSVPPGNRGHTKMVLVLLIAGVAILVAAAVVYMNRKPSESEATEGPKVDETIYVAPKPLVTAPARPLAERSPDAGTAAQDSPAAPEKKSARGQAGEKLGTVDAAAVNKYIADHFGQVRACYERRLKMNPLLRGDLDLSISISSAGKATSIGVSSDTVRDREMLDCVKRTIRTWSFPKPEGGRAVIAKNFKFKPKS